MIKRLGVVAVFIMILLAAIPLLVILKNNIPTSFDGCVRKHSMDSNKEEYNRGGRSAGLSFMVVSKKIGMIEPYQAIDADAGTIDERVVLENVDHFVQECRVSLGRWLTSKLIRPIFIFRPFDFSARVPGEFGSTYYVTYLNNDYKLPSDYLECTEYTNWDSRGKFCEIDFNRQIIINNKTHQHPHIFELVESKSSEKCIKVNDMTSHAKTQVTGHYDTTIIYYSEQYCNSL